MLRVYPEVVLIRSTRRRIQRSIRSLTIIVSTKTFSIGYGCSNGRLTLLLDTQRVRAGSTAEQGGVKWWREASSDSKVEARVIRSGGRAARAQSSRSGIRKEGGTLTGRGQTSGKTTSGVPVACQW
ncbi:hypothetical protein AAG570_008515 [Ranatra chinensis]|uniref:Uncharacterized protein n=1 Tax=Ranatra chinensis TaxID=642074 RepID=A0ABD0YR69_9HEMI